MSRWPPLFLWIVALNASAIDDERVIQEMARRTTLTTDEIRAEYKTGCESGNTISMRICASFNALAADLELNDTYKSVLKTLDKDARAKLLKAQRAWIVYRDATCDYESNRGGSADGLYFSSCKETLTRDRTKRLIETAPESE